VEDDKRIALYRERAIEAERVAGSARDPDVRSAFRQIADSWWLLAGERVKPAAQDDRLKRKRMV
jgi:hypothetical protein